MTEQIKIPAEIAERHAFLEAKIREIASDISSVVCEDLPSFVLREFRSRFISNPGFSMSFSSEQVKSLKSRLQEAANEKKAELQEQLANMEIWLHPEAESTDARSLRGNAKVWEILGGIASFARELLVLNSFPADPDGGYKISYKTPSMFLTGKYCPALIESYWLRLGELRESTEKIEQFRSEKLAETLKRLWDDS